MDRTLVSVKKRGFGKKICADWYFMTKPKPPKPVYAFAPVAKGQIYLNAISTCERECRTWAAITLVEGKVSIWEIKVLAVKEKRNVS